MSRPSRRLSVPLLTILFFGFVASAIEAASPSLSLILPRGAQRGTETEFRFRGQRLADAEEILFYEPGLSTVKIEPTDRAENLMVTLKIADDCRLGEHTVQVRCKSGVSDFRTILIGALPEVAEKEPNSDFAEPQPIEMNVTVNGVVDQEDVDYYAVQAKKGQRLSVEIEAMRLGSYAFDPAIAILDQRRFELDLADDSPLARQDAVVSAIIPEDGTYIVEVRESAYGGNGNCRYRLHIGDFPRPRAVYPAGGKLGEEVELTWLGDAGGPLPRKVKLPAKPQSDFGLFLEQDGRIAPSENSFRLSQVGNVLEVEPNNDRKAATPGELPLAFNGVIQEPGDFDYFKFTAKKNETFEVECYARRLRSPLDPVMYLYDANGKRLASNDDSRSLDSYFRFKAPADGDYYLGVRDHLKGGGPNHVYRVEFQPVEPALTISIPRATRYGQERQQIVIPRGGRWGTTITASRQNFNEEIELISEGLPEGVTVHALPMPKGQNSMPVVFEAKADAKIAGQLVDLRARSTNPEKPVTGHFENDAILVRGPGNATFVGKVVKQVPVAVVEELPYQIRIVQPKVPVVQNGTMELKIAVERNEGFDGEITLEFPFRPPGVNAASTVKIPKDKSDAVYPLNAAGNAAVGDWPIFVLAQANVSGPAFCSSQLATLKVAPPYVKFAMKRAAAEQGKETSLFVEVEQVTPFEGEAQVKLLGLPHKVEAGELKLTKEQAELAFPVKIDASSPVGTHKSIVCQLVITDQGEPITHRLGSTELRIDKPLPPPKDEPKKTEVAEKKPAQPQPKPQAEKPLSRLEQLRLDAQKKLQTGAE